MVKYFCIDGIILPDLISNHVSQSCYVEDVNISLIAQEAFLRLLILVMLYLMFFGAKQAPSLLDVSR